jgi:hypothetical protein
VRVDTERKAKLEALAHDYGNCSQSAVIRQHIEEQYHHVFGELDPEALAGGQITDKQKRQIINGASPEDVVDEAFLLTPEDEDIQNSPVDTDGGAIPTPNSYSMTLGPAELRQSGPELTWTQLRKSVSEDGHWGDDLVIHPDRVPSDELKSSHKYTPRIIAGILRHKATDYDLVPDSTITDTIDEYLLSLHDRLNEHAGRQYIHDTYRPLIEAHLYASPSPDSNAYFTTESAQIDAAEAILERRLEVPDYVDTPEDVLDVERWHHCLNINGTTETSIDHWLDDVAAFMKSIASLKSVVMTVTETHRIPADYPETYTDLGQYLVSLKKSYCRRYLQTVGAKYPTAVRSRMSEACVDLLAPDGI